VRAARTARLGLDAVQQHPALALPRQALGGEVRVQPTALRSPRLAVLALEADEPVDALVVQRREALEAARMTHREQRRRWREDGGESSGHGTKIPTVKLSPPVVFATAWMLRSAVLSDDAPLMYRSSPAMWPGVVAPSSQNT
jgi:hypothetical protein